MIWLKIKIKNSDKSIKLMRIKNKKYKERISQNKDFMTEIFNEIN